ncbi:GNAT family N-acetyltransferase [Maritimibacter sp. 55A14]|uniref:GNAT family N-acetyltransferase n=1 Tax=Maritimibacter sp. 55A14 TaxID=2174844 RepID=UPI000D60E807|nr:GNAT family N-acetyltransferase [Maritimibacter sp. 55A14]PWE28403.1 GNAT family N-acetyltransferase [Maritimibacter sp. 55A14]
MTRAGSPRITLARLPDIPLQVLVEHMSDPRVAEHMPLLKDAWNRDIAADFVAAKEACWHRDGLGHWAILADNRYLGWGGFQMEGGEWDFALVLKPDAFGLGARIARKALAFARADARISVVTFLLAPSRRNLRALERLGATFVAEVEYAGAPFLKYRMEMK